MLILSIFSFMAIVILLKEYDNHPVPYWSFHPNLSATRFSRVCHRQRVLCAEAANHRTSPQCPIFYKSRVAGDSSCNSFVGILQIYVAFCLPFIIWKGKQHQPNWYTTGDTDDRHSDKFLIPSFRSTKGWLCAYSDNGWTKVQQRARCQVHWSLRRLESPITIPANPLERWRSKSVSRLTSETRETPDPSPWVRLPSHVLSHPLNISSKSSVKLLFRPALKRIFSARPIKLTKSIERKKREGRHSLTLEYLLRRTQARRASHAVPKPREANKPLFFLIQLWCATSYCWEDRTDSQLRYVGGPKNKL
jgi:hypothetical protein